MSETENELLNRMPGHASVAHNFKALSETGYVKNCFRCNFLKGNKNSFKRALRRYSPPTPNGESEKE